MVPEFQARTPLSSAVAAALLLAACHRGAPATAPSPPSAARAVAPATLAPPPESRTAPSPASAATDAPDYSSGPADALADDVPSDAYPTQSGAVPDPLAGRDNATLEKMLVEHPAELGSMSIGKPNGGALFNGVQLLADEHFALADASHAWGTEETVDFLHAAMRVVVRQFPDVPKLYIGHISAKNGGPLRPHVSHQCGRDVDVGFFYLDAPRWYARGTRDNLDLPRTWAFARAVIENTDVEMILIDRSIQVLLREYAASIGEDPSWLAGVFQGIPGRAPPIFRHAAGHATHMHIRFFNPVAQQTARHMLPLLVAHQFVHPGVSYISHRAKPGETLGMLSRKYGVSVQAIRAANGLRGNVIRANASYKIPQANPPVAAMPPLVIPPRRIPPPRSEPSARAK